MNFFKTILYLFLPYTDPQERKIARVFEQIKKHHLSPMAAKQAIQQLMQEDLVRLNLYQEWKFKRYKNLGKFSRKKSYQNAEKIRTDFLRSIPKNISKEQYLQKIMEYLSPQKNFEYQLSAAFEKLLQDPKKQKLVGDCNQICTLYLWFWSFRFPVSEWKIRSLPKHVCLHFNEKDIECTNGQFANYNKGKVLPIEELISINILDISDQERSKYQISAENFLNSAEIIMAISSEKNLAKLNLKTAYHNMGISLLKNEEFKKAALFFEKTNRPDLVQEAWKNATKKAIKNEKFLAAKKYANKTNDREFIMFAEKSHGIFELEKNNFLAAEKIFKRIDDQKSLKIVWQNQLFELNNSIKNYKTIDQIRTKKSVIQKMLKLSRKIPNRDMQKFCEDILRKI